MSTDIKNQIAELRQKADTLDFIERLKSGTGRKDFIFKFYSAMSGRMISVETQNKVVKLPVADCADELIALLTTFFENKLNPKTQETGTEVQQ